MNSLIAWSSLLLGYAVAACGGAPVASNVDVDVAVCSQPIGGPFSLPAATAVEAVSGYDKALNDANLRDVPKALLTNDLGRLERSLIAYMMEWPQEAVGDVLDRDELIAQGPMGRAVVYAFYVAKTQDWDGADTDTLRRGLQRFYACTRRVPMDLDGFKAAVFDPTALPIHELHSNAKNHTRRLRSDPKAGFWMAETVVDGLVRETEIILSNRRGDGALDFLAYDEHGKLMDRSRFETPDQVDISGAAPYVCIICHSSTDDFFPDTVYPTGRE